MQDGDDGGYGANLHDRRICGDSVRFGGTHNEAAPGTFAGRELEQEAKRIAGGDGGSRRRPHLRR